ncbi:hypothetical protein FGO68_gene1637 [Halteria grandinella]|uniref:Uncharacterized protein n=1 Tax=Halteria grandinella TaxID=5974 RepID=A0A8J8NYA0_HALGN|nr:hypothetical protein FGO68_gene1637 [Halteria grandinella]
MSILGVENIQIQNVPGLSQIQRNLLSKKNQQSPKDILIERLCKAGSQATLMIKNIRSLSTIQAMIASRKIGLLKELILKNEQYLVFRSQQSRAWVAIVRVLGISNEQFLENEASRLKPYYFEEYMGLPFEKLKFYDVEIILKCFVPMKQTEFLLSQLKDERLDDFDKIKLNFIRELTPIDSHLDSTKELLTFMFDKHLPLKGDSLYKWADSKAKLLKQSIFKQPSLCELAQKFDCLSNQQEGLVDVDQGEMVEQESTAGSPPQTCGDKKLNEDPQSIQGDQPLCGGEVLVYPIFQNLISGEKVDELKEVPVEQHHQPSDTNTDEDHHSNTLNTDFKTIEENRPISVPQNQEFLQLQAESKINPARNHGQTLDDLIKKEKTGKEVYTRDKREKKYKEKKRHRYESRERSRSSHKHKKQRSSRSKSRKRSKRSDSRGKKDLKRSYRSRSKDRKSRKESPSPHSSTHDSYHSSSKHSSHKGHQDSKKQKKTSRERDERVQRKR